MGNFSETQICNRIKQQALRAARDFGEYNNKTFFEKTQVICSQLGSVIKGSAVIEDDLFLNVMNSFGFTEEDYTYLQELNYRYRYLPENKKIIVINYFIASVIAIGMEEEVKSLKEAKIKNEEQNSDIDNEVSTEAKEVDYRGLILKMTREIYGFSQEKVILDLNISKNFLPRIEKGDTKEIDINVNGILEFYGLSWQSLEELAFIYELKKTEYINIIDNRIFNYKMRSLILEKILTDDSIENENNTKYVFEELNERLLVRKERIRE